MTVTRESRRQSAFLMDVRGFHLYRGHSAILECKLQKDQTLCILFPTVSPAPTQCLAHREHAHVFLKINEYLSD